MALPALKPKLSVEDYLDGEKLSVVRHEYVGGEVYAMAGTSEEHNTIAINVTSELHRHLRGKPCKVFMSEIKVKVWLNHDIFYYPDIMVACDPNDKDRYFKHKPKVLMEIISESTRRIDEQEKLLTYLRIDSLEEYVLIEQESMQVAVFRRSNAWQREELSGESATLTLNSLGFSMPLTQIYEGVGG
jgi:Uma2 family endonuclease